MGRNSRRRTTSNPSSEPTGFQMASMRPKVCSIRASVSRPASPPISMSDSGMVATSTVFRLARTASVSSWMKVCTASKVPEGSPSTP